MKRKKHKKQNNLNKMKQNRQILFIMGLAAVALLASCKKNNGEDGNVPEKGFRATVEQTGGNNGGSRTHINPDWANDANTDVLWTSEDQIKVANGNGSSLNFQLSSGENTSNGIFNSGSAQEDFFQPDYVAGYPAGNVTAISSTTVTFNMPATQTYNANSFAEGAMPMVATSTTQELAFKNVFGGICFPLVGDGVTVTSIVLTGGADEHLSGSFEVNAATGAMTSTPSGSNSVTLDCSANGGVALDATNPTYFCIMVPPASLADGFSITVNDNAGGSKELSTTANPNITRSNIQKVNTNFEMASFAGLTFEARDPYSSVYIEMDYTQQSQIQIEYSTDGIIWNKYTAPQQIFLPNVGDKVMFRGDNDATSYSPYGLGRFCSTGRLYVYGNVMSLLDKEIDATIMPEYGFYQLFRNNNCIYNHPDYPIVLPATTLGNRCYLGMFDGCTNLTSAPELPATTLAEYCYTTMFQGCTSLTTAPELPATTLAFSCYSGMFQSCTSLTTAPELPATSMTNGCYERMFFGCTALTVAPELPATSLANMCYEKMFMNCTALTTAPAELPATSLIVGCYAEMFRGCTALTTAPELPAPSLESQCYKSMFQGCTSLNYIKCLATNIAFYACTQDWVKDVSATGTFVKAASMEDWPICPLIEVSPLAGR